MALALGYQRAGDLLRAKEYTMQALVADPGTPVALTNMGAILCKEGDSLRALYYLRLSNDAIPRTLRPCTASPSDLKQGDIEQAQKAFPKVLEIEAPEDLRGLARNVLREIAAPELKARGPRMDAVFYLLDAMRLFRGKSLQEIREIAFKIGMLGKYGLDINDPKEIPGPAGAAGEGLPCAEYGVIMYAGFKRIEPAPPTLAQWQEGLLHLTFCRTQAPPSQAGSTSTRAPVFSACSLASIWA